MKPSIAIIVLVILSVAGPCFAHRLDEYLQSAKVSIQADRIGIDLTLTPGVAVLPTLLESFDADHDGTVSNAEQTAYLTQVRNDLLLTLDGAPASITIETSRFPETAEMNDGLGEIAIRLEAPTVSRSGTHHLILENHHLNWISVYLVNCLVPSDPHIRITAQDRSYDQRVYRVDYEQADAAASPTTATTTFADTQMTSISLFNGYVLHGVGHILTGYDHLLFVGALVLAANTLWDLIKVVSAFTLAHTLTLTLAAMGFVHVSERIVEPLISASIVFVSVQNVFWPKRARGWSRLGAAFFFGLFHGLGFAGGLLNAMQQLPSTTMLLAIVAFSLGVEIGHQLVVLPLFALGTALRGRQREEEDPATQASLKVRRLGSACISIAGFYYLLAALMPSL